MGLFSKKAKAPEIDMAASDANKRKMREVFRQTVPEGDSYKIVHAGSSDSTLSSGFFVDTRTTTFHNYIVGYRESDYQLAVVEIDKELTQWAEPVYLAINEVKDVSYEKKYHHIWFIYKESGRGYGLKLGVSDRPANAPYMLPNLKQEGEGGDLEQFLDFLEKYSARLSEMGFKVEKWKR